MHLTLSMRVFELVPVILTQMTLIC